MKPKDENQHPLLIFISILLYTAFFWLFLTLDMIIPCGVIVALFIVKKIISKKISERKIEFPFNEKIRYLMEDTLEVI